MRIILMDRQIPCCQLIQVKSTLFLRLFHPGFPASKKNMISIKVIGRSLIKHPS